MDVIRFAGGLLWMLFGCGWVAVRVFFWMVIGARVVLIYYWLRLWVVGCCIVVTSVVFVL